MKIKGVVKHPLHVKLGFCVVALFFVFSNTTNAEYATVDNKLPMYGTIAWSSQDRKQIPDYFDYIDSVYDSRQAAAKDLNVEAWDAYLNDNRVEAMRLFNLSWLLNNTNIDTYAGYVRILALDGKHKDAIEVGELALGLGGMNYDLISELAVSYAYYGESFYSRDNKGYFARAHYLLSLADSLKPNCNCGYEDQFFVSMLEQKYSQAQKIREVAELSNNPLSKESIDWLEGFDY